MSSRGNSTITNRKIRDLSILSSVCLYFILRIFINLKGGLIGGAYFFSAYNLILLFLISVPWGLLEITARHTRERMENNLYKNAKRVMYFGIVIGIIYSAIVCLILFLFRKGICIFFLNGENCELCLLLLLPLILFKSVSAVFKGFMLGSKLKTRLYSVFFLENLAMLVCVLFLSNVFTSYGQKVSNILFDEKINSAFAASGVALGLSASAFIGLVACIVAVAMADKHLDEDDATKRIDDIYDLGMKMFSEVFVLGFSTIFCIAFNFINQLMFNKFYNEELTTSSRLYQYGSYYSAFWTIIICPVLFTFVYSFLDRRSVRIGYLDNNKSELRAKVSYMIKQFFAYSIPFVAFVFINSDIIGNYLINGDSTLVTKFIRFGIWGLVLFGISLIYTNVLIGLDRTYVNTIISILATAINIVAVFMCFTKTNLGLMSLVVGFYSYVIIHAFLGMIFTSKFLKFRIKIFYAVMKPIIVGILVGAFTLLLKIIFNLFAPGFVTLLITGIMTLLISFIAYIRMRAFTYQAIKRSSLGFILVPFGKMIGLFKEK